MLAFGGLPTVSAQTPVFPQALTYKLPQPPSDSALGTAITDLNNDKKPDLVYLGSKAVYTVMDLTNPASTLQLTSYTCTTTGTQTPLIADLNKDGNPDVVFTCTNYVVVLLGKGDGTFRSPAYYAVNALWPAVLADLNHDGYSDLIVATCGTCGTSPEQLLVFLNERTAAPGAFGTPVAYPSGAVGNGIGPLAVGDFNGDGKQDVIGMTASTGTDGTPVSGVTVFQGNGDGTLQAGKVAGTQGSQVFTTGDLNGDGITDLVIVNLDQTGNSLNAQVLFGASDGTFTTGPALPVGGNYVTTAVLTTSGALDIVASTPSTVVYHGDGKGNFSQTGNYAAFGTPFAFDVNSTGKQDLLLVNASGEPAILNLSGNGDGTFAGVPATAVPSAVVADENDDGLADLVTITPLNNQPAIVTWIGRGDGTFLALSPTSPTPGNALVVGDFNGDGKNDLIALATGTGELYFQAGNGNGTFQAAGPGVNLGVPGSGSGVTGDFNRDGKLDLVVAYNNPFAKVPSAGLVFLPGNGDGTFGAPVNFAQVSAQRVLAGDLNKDGKLDLIADGTVFLGNGDGTFKQIPLTPSLASGFSLEALADVNGDGFPDLIVSVGGPQEVNVYLGNGDGTFEATPSFSFVPPLSASLESAAVGEVNGDSHPDLIVYYYNIDAAASYVAVAYGDGTGNFNTDTNAYFAGYFSLGSASQLTLTRLNNQATVGSGDNKLDALVMSGTSTTALLNANNAVPAAPSVFAASVSLQSSTSQANENQNVTLTAMVTGLNPTGSVTFTAGSTPLGSATVTSGVATLTTTFAASGNYAITSDYSGDPNNTVAQSNEVTIGVAAPDFAISANSTSASLTPGQSATFTLTVTPSGGYAGTVKFSCGSLPSEVTCTFTPQSATPTNGTAATTSLSIVTTAAVANAAPGLPMRLPWTPGALTLAGLLGLTRIKRARARFRMMREAGWMVLLTAALLIAGGCGSSSSSNKGSSNPGTPEGTYPIMVTVTDSAGGPTHNLALTITVK